MTRSRDFDILCFSHLKFEKTLFQRPQQLMTQLSRESKVLYLANCRSREFVEALFKGRLGDYYGWKNENLYFFHVPYLPFQKYFPPFHWIHWWIYTSAVKRMTRKMDFQNTLVWVYHPDCLVFLKLAPKSRVVYDCMDFFRGFLTSSKKIEENEMKMLKRADIVFTGGRSLQRSKEGVNPRTYCFPSGVEYDHFGKAMLPETTIPEDIASIPGPILGYFGAVDERLDYNLINYLCEKRRDCSVVIIGPMVLYEFPPVDQPNFYYLGKKNYQDLPNYLKAFDVALMPFARTELTAHISPTKTPEYLSGGKPVVSTAVPDVVADYSDVVGIAHDYPEFVAKVGEALNEDGKALAAKVRKKAETQSWESIANEMRRLIGELDARAK